MKINRKAKKVLVGLAVLGSVFAAGCGGPKAPKEMTFDELITDWTQNIEKVTTEQDKMVEDYVKKDPETYKLFTLKDSLNVTATDEKINKLNLSKEQLDKTASAIKDIKSKTKPQVDRMNEEKEQAKQILIKRAYDKDQMKLESDKIRYSKAASDFDTKINAKDSDRSIRNRTRFGTGRHSLFVITGQVQE